MHVVDNLRRGGLENGVANLLTRLDPARFEHIVCAVRGLGPNADRLTAAGVQVVPLFESGSESRFQVPLLVKAIRKYQPDIVHSRNWAAIEAVVAARVARATAVVHSEHGFEADIAAAEPRRRIWFRRIAFELATRVLSVSYQLRTLHASRTGFSAERITVIHNGVDRTRFFPDAQIRQRTRSQLGLRDDELCIGCVANLLPVKDHMTLLRAAERMAEGRSDWRLLLVGEGFLRPTLEAFVAGNPLLRNRVQFLGPSSEVPNFLRALDVFVLPSLAEGICNSLLEAMSTGLAVIATAVGGNPEIVVDGESGLLFQARDVDTLTQRLLTVKDQPDLRQRLGQGAIERVRDEFSIDAMVQAYHDLYSSLCPLERVSVASVI